jgi:PAS domain S-box-containing protein
VHSPAQDQATPPLSPQPRRAALIALAAVLLAAGFVLALSPLAGPAYGVAWYFSRAAVLVITAALFVVLLGDNNRLMRSAAANQRRLRGIVDGVADALLSVDARGAVVSANRAASSLFGFSAEEMIGTAVTRVLPDYATVAGAQDVAVVETIGRDARGTLFPVEFARGRDVTSVLGGERIIILRDITQRKAAEEAIRAAHDRAIEAAEVKSQFLATMSHEIRTPINAVVGMSELLLGTPLSEEARDYALTVRDSADSLLAIVNDILDFSKIEAGRLELESIPFAPVAALENATDILSAAARKKGLSLTTYVAPDVPRRVLGDVDRLRQIFLNLIGNAVKFTEHGSVTVRAVVERVEAEKTVVLRFSVTDTGPGIGADVAGHLFEPFRQADQSTRRRYGGTGLGLSISRRLVELMDGAIGFESAAGSGATFWFTVPFAQVVRDGARMRAGALRGARVLVVDPEDHARQAVDQYLFAWGVVASSTANAAHGVELAKASVRRGAPFDAAIVDRAAGTDAYAFGARLHAVAGFEAVPIVLVSGSPEVSSLAEARVNGFAAVVRKPIRRSVLHDALAAAIDGTDAPSIPVATFDGVVAPRGSDVLVLVAEDNPVNRKLALQQLKKLGYRAHAVTDGREAIEAVTHGGYDLVLMDCQMPEVDGFEATRAIRRAENARGGHVPIVAMTANVLEGDREACLEAGMDAYLAKPVQLAALGALVERFVSGVRVAG